MPDEGLGPAHDTDRCPLCRAERGVCGFCVDGNDPLCPLCGSDE